MIGGEEDSHPAVMKLYVTVNTFLTLFFAAVVSVVFNSQNCGRELAHKS